MNYPELRLDATFENLSNLNVLLSETQNVEAEFGNVYVVGGGKVLYATTATWNSQPQLMSARGYIYIYSDWKQDDQGNNIAGMKIGTGNAYLIDLGFKEQIFYDHIMDVVKHVTQEEREFWNNKVTCFESTVEGELLIFTKNKEGT